MPVRDGFASAATLTCSLEHFEGNADTGLFLELARVLKPGGRVVVAPLYLHRHPVTVTDPRYSAAVDVPFDPDTVLYCWDWHNRHGRIYSAATLKSRLIDPTRAMFDFCVYEILSPRTIDPSVYAQFALVARKRG